MPITIILSIHIYNAENVEQQNTKNGYAVQTNLLKEKRKTKKNNVSLNKVQWRDVEYRKSRLRQTKMEGSQVKRKVT